MQKRVGMRMQKACRQTQAAKFRCRVGELLVMRVEESSAPWFGTKSWPVHSVQGVRNLFGMFCLQL
jgi:hypothetical protein